MLNIQQLSASIEQHRLFDALHCTLQAGELLLVMGENGSGKTSLLRVLAGLNRQYSGQVSWNNQDIREHWHDYAAQLLYLGHQPALKSQLSARENLAWYASSVQASSEQIETALKTLGIVHKAHLPCHRLSAGQQRRVALARLFFSNHPLWILDEPFTALDTRGFALIAERLQQHCAQGGIAVLTTHHGSEQLGLTHRTLALSSASQKQATAR